MEKSTNISGNRRAVVLVSGLVQGVGFRYWTSCQARELYLKGYVKNLSDGRVEAVFEGSASDVEQMLTRLHTGPNAAEVDSVEIEREEVTGTFRDFSILQ